MMVLAVLMAAILVLSLFAVPSEAIKPKSLKKDFKDIKTPIQEKSVKITKISKPRTLHIWYIAEVQVCAGSEKLYSPELELSSDRDTIQVTMWGIIMPKSCKSGEFFIAANDPDSISASFANQSFREPAK